MSKIEWNREKLKALFVKFETRQGCPLSLLLKIQYRAGSLSRAVRQQKEIKDIQIGKEKIKLSPLII